jgi:hypothetical protein
MPYMPSKIFKCLFEPENTFYYPASVQRIRRNNVNAFATVPINNLHMSDLAVSSKIVDFWHNLDIVTKNLNSFNVYKSRVRHMILETQV